MFSLKGILMQEEQPIQKPSNESVVSAGITAKVKPLNGTFQVAEITAIKNL